jgi:hypothetical protein
MSVSKAPSVRVSPIKPCKKAADILRPFVVPTSASRLASPAITIPAIIPRAVVRVCGTKNAPVLGTIVGGSVVARPVSAVIGRGVAVAVVRRSVPAVVSRGIAAIVTVRAIGVSAGRYTTDHRASNESARETGTPTPTTPPSLSW